MGHIRSPLARTVSAKGFSLVELLVALVISMVIAAAMAALFAQSVKSRDQVDTDGQRIEGGRYALDVLADNLRHAGFYGDYLPRSSSGAPWPAANSTGATWTTPQPCAVAVANLGWANSGTVNVPVHIMGYEAHPSGTLPAALTGCLPNYKTNTDVLVIRRVSTVSYTPGAAGAAVGEVFLQASDCTGTTDGGTKFIVDAKAGGGSNFNLHNLKCSVLSSINKYIVRIYYVANCDMCLPTSDNIPTLKMSELLYSGGSLQMVTNSVASGIDDIHIEYGVDANGDGAPDVFAVSVSDPITSPPGFAWQNVMSAKAYVLARDLKATPGYVDTKTYILGGATISPANTSYRRNVFSATVRLMNPSAAREQP